MRVLLANEFGRGSGHFLLLKGIIENVRALGPDSEFKLLLPAQYEGREIGVPRAEAVFPKEISHFQPTKAFTGLADFGEVVGSILLDPKRSLLDRLEMWSRQIADFRPHVIVADYAPTLLMYARGRWPTVHVGVGYTLPPPEAAQFPDFRPRRHEKIYSDEFLLESINHALKAVSAKTLGHLPQMNQADSYGLATIPLFDPYWQSRKQKYLGVYHPGGTPSPAPSHDANTIIAYFGGDSESDTILEGLAATGLHAKVHLAGSSVTKLRTPSTLVALENKPFELARDLPGKALALHGGTLGFASAAMFAGVPQISLFDNDEGQGNAAATIMAKIGLAAPRKETSAMQIAEMCMQAMAQENMRKLSIDLSHRYAAFRQAKPTVEVADIVLRVAGS